MKRVRLEKGKRAPFSGQLLSDAAVATLLSEYKVKIKELELRATYLKKRVEAKLEALDNICQVEMRAEEQKRKICEDARKAERSVYNKALNRVSKEAGRKWYESPYLHLLLGIGVGIGGTAAAGALR